MNIDKKSSDRLKVLRFPLIVGVVFIHAFKTEVGLQNGMVGVEGSSYFSEFVRNIISQGVARISVPLFFLMSGYFVFLGFSWSKEDYKKKLQSRIKTLLIPFLFWNITVLLLIAFAQYIPATKVYFSGKIGPVSTFGAYDYLNAIFGLQDYPISYQFWFIRDLMVMILFVPLLYLIYTVIPKCFLVVVTLLWFFNIWPVYIPSAAAFTFFSAGAFFALLNYSLFSFDRLGFRILLVYVAVVLIDTLSKPIWFNPYIHKIGLVLGIVSVLYLSQFLIIRYRVKRFLVWAGGFSFFVFAVHEPLLNVVRKIVFKALGSVNEVTVMALYFIIPSFIIIMSLFIAVGVKCVSPKLFNVISGGRN